MPVRDGRILRRRVARYLGWGGAPSSMPDRPASGRRGCEAEAAEGDALVVIVVFAPLTHVDAVRDAAASAGAGAIGDYRACSFSVTGEGRFEPLEGAQPHIGAVGRPEVVQEQRIEVVCPRRVARRALDAMLAAHPYEEPAWHAYRTLSRDDLG